MLQETWREGPRHGMLGKLERFLGGARGDRRPPPSHAHLLEAARDVLALLQSFQATADMPHAGERAARQAVRGRLCVAGCVWLAGYGWGQRLRPRSGCGPACGHHSKIVKSSAAELTCLNVLCVSPPTAAEPPDPATIKPRFVSLGEAKAALAAGVQRCQTLLMQLDPAGALGL